MAIERRSRVIEIDRGWKAIKASLRVAANRVGQVGIFPGTRNEETGQAVAEYALSMEYGNPGKNVPERPFIRHTMDAHERKIFGLMASEARLLYDSKGRSLPTFLKATTEHVEELMVGEVMTAKDWAVALRQRTIDEKGHDLPLLDSFSLLNAIQSRVTTRGTLRRRLAREA